MLYYLFEYLDKFNFPGAGVFQYLSFRAALATVTSLVVSMIFGKKIIAVLTRKQIGETIRELGLPGEEKKKDTPTMGGIIIIAAILIPVLLFAKLRNIYIILMLITTVWLGLVGFLDDYIKTFKKDKKGLPGKFKVIAQVILGLIVGGTFYFSNEIQMREKPFTNVTVGGLETTPYVYPSNGSKPIKTTIPFVKNNEFDYEDLLPFIGKHRKSAAWILFTLVVIFIVTAVSNAANLTDGMDGLAAGTSSIIGATLGIFAYLSGNFILADYLNIMYLPSIGELLIFAAAFMGATIGFLWYNANPAQVFMGDTGSLTLGGIIAVFAIIVRKEFLLPLLAGIFFVEALSVIIQTTWFKYTRKRFGKGRRIFLISPLHHHFQKKGIHESKLVVRFWIVGIALAILSVITLKIR
ncbi:MAG: phospho-N-acetylmuramoyl-pentapeptide-transferase [Bacteroidia bacterium]|nr:MAG: phospho-N-acetylmuramoyl-pentapeptide-transferase [Bacteroidia bacterium]